MFFNVEKLLEGSHIWYGLSRDDAKALLQLLSSQVPQNVVLIAWKPGNVSSTFSTTMM